MGCWPQAHVRSVGSPCEAWTGLHLRPWCWSPSWWPLVAGWWRWAGWSVGSPCVAGVAYRRLLRCWWPRGWMTADCLGWSLLLLPRCCNTLLPRGPPLPRTLPHFPSVEGQIYFKLVVPFTYCNLIFTSPTIPLYIKDKLSLILLTGMYFGCKS